MGRTISVHGKDYIGHCASCDTRHRGIFNIVVGDITFSLCEPCLYAVKGRLATTIGRIENKHGNDHKTV